MPGFAQEPEPLAHSYMNSELKPAGYPIASLAGVALRKSMVLKKTVRSCTEASACTTAEEAMPFEWLVTAARTL